jgi:hypothetical protein
MTVNELIALLSDMPIELRELRVVVLTQYPTVQRIEDIEVLIEGGPPSAVRISNIRDPNLPTPESRHFSLLGRQRVSGGIA